MIELRSRFQEQVVEGMATGAARWKTRTEIEDTGDFGGYTTPIVFGEYELVAYDRAELLDVYRRRSRPLRRGVAALLLGSGRYEHVGRSVPIRELHLLFEARARKIWEGWKQNDLDALDAATGRGRT